MREVIATSEELAEERLANAERSGQQAAKQDKEWVKSKLESIDTVALHYRKEGVDGAEAFEKARAQQLKVLERALAQEEARLQLYTKRNEKQWDEYNNRSFWKQGLGIQKAANTMINDINESFSLVEQQTAYIDGYMDGPDAVLLSVSLTGTGGISVLQSVKRDKSVWNIPIIVTGPPDMQTEKPKCDFDAH